MKPEWQRIDCTCGAVAGEPCLNGIHVHSRGLLMIKRKGFSAVNNILKPDPYQKCHLADDWALSEMRTALGRIEQALQATSSAITGRKCKLRPSYYYGEHTSLAAVKKDMLPMIREIEGLLKRLDPQ